MGGAKAGEPRRGVGLLAIGALAGALIAAAGIVERPRRAEIPEDAVAVVNGAAIRRVDYERAVASIVEATKKDGDPSVSVAAAKERAIERLVDEELLIQRGIELGLPASDPQIRAAISARVLEMATAAAGEDGEPSDDSLRKLYEEQGDRLRAPARRRVAVLFFSAPMGGPPEADEQAKRRAEDARRRMSEGEPLAEVAKSSDPSISTPPDALLPLAKLGDYLGKTATRALLDVNEGGCTPPVRGADGYRVVRLLEVAGGELPDFTSVRGEILAEARRRRADERVREMLSRRRASSKVIVTNAL